MHYDFDKITNREGTNSFKYDLRGHFGLDNDILPLWVADMDFEIPPPCLR